MAERPFLFSDVVILAANSTGSLTYQVPIGEHFDGGEMWLVSTGTFSIEDFRNNSGQRFSNCSAAEPILSTMLDKPQTVGQGVLKFDPPIHIDPSGIFYLDLKDTSGAPNTVTCVINGKRTTV